MPHQHFVACLVGAALLVGLSCTGGQTGDEGLADGTEFHGSQCDKAGLDEVSEGLSVAALSSEYDGLACLAWQREDDGTLQLELTNVSGPCLVEVDWQHRVARSDGGLQLVASGEPECRIAGCGSCDYDFRFALPLERPNEPLRVSFGLEICEALEDPWLVTTLPLDDADHGILCRQLSSSSQVWHGRCGAAHQPCCSEGEPGAASGSCQAGLSCQQAQEALCLTPCESEADCPLPAVESCEEGLCQVPATF